jgi:hypothetical protein
MQIEHRMTLKYTENYSRGAEGQGGWGALPCSLAPVLGGFGDFGVGLLEG